MNYKERTQEIFERAERLKKKNKRKIITAITAVGLSLAVFAGVLFVPYPIAGMPDVSAYKDSEYYPLIQTLNQLTYKPPRYKNNWEKWTDGVSNFFLSLGPAGGMPSAPSDGVDGTTSTGGATSGTASAEGYVETTDNQVAGVIEGDLMKRSENYIYYLSYDYEEKEKAVLEWTCRLNVYSVAGEESEKVATYTLQSEEGYDFSYNLRANELYLSADGAQITVITLVYDEAAKKTRTAVVPIDVSDVSNITQGEISYVSGDYVSSRYVDGKLLLITNFQVYNPDFSKPESYLPQAGKKGGIKALPMREIFLPEGATQARYTLICAFEGDNITSHTAFLSYAQEVYVSAQNIYLTRQYSVDAEAGYSETVTEIARVDYSTGELIYKGGTTVKGSVLNQYSMDERAGILRVVTTTRKNKKAAANGNGYNVSLVVDRESNVSLFCVDINTFERVAKLENFAPEGEIVRSVRFEENKVNVCTAIEFIDPVFVIDLTDLQNITVKDSGVIGGYSVALKKFKDDTLLGIGYDEYGDLKIELYQEGAAGVNSVASYVGEYVFSEKYKSYFIDSENGYIGLCVNEYYRNGGESYYLLLRYDGTQLTEAGLLPMETSKKEVVRACMADGYLYVVSDKDFIVTIP